MTVFPKVCLTYGKTAAGWAAVREDINDLFAGLALDELDQLHDGNDGEGQAHSHRVLGPGDHLEAESVGQEGNFQNSGGQHRILQLLDEALEQGGLFGSLELVGAVLGQAILCLGSGQTLSPYAEVAQNFFRGLGVGFLRILSPFYNLW